MWSKFNFKILKANPILNRTGHHRKPKLLILKLLIRKPYKLKFNHNLIYDEITKEWKTIKIDAVYKKK